MLRASNKPVSQTADQVTPPKDSRWTFDSCNIWLPSRANSISRVQLPLATSPSQRFQGLTPEGERVLKWAKLMLQTWSAMKLELDQLGSDNLSLSGRLSIGAIPSALPVVPRLTGQVRSDHPNIDFSISSMSSAKILRGLEEFTIDVGIT